MLTNRLSVLVVEDDVEVRGIISGVLSDAGFKVVTAATGWTALKIIQNKPFDLVVADIALPGDFSGVELLQCARLTRPNLRCLFVSGGVEGASDDPDRDDFVGKPFHRNELLGCAWELLLRDVPERQPGWEQRQAERILVAAKVASRKPPTAGRGKRRSRTRSRPAQSQAYRRSA